jgi:hypothetical protein
MADIRSIGSKLRQKLLILDSAAIVLFRESRQHEYGFKQLNEPVQNLHAIQFIANYFGQSTPDISASYA